MAVEENTTLEKPDNILEFPSKVNSKTMNNLILGFIPFTPVQLSGPDALIGWGRIAAYSLLAYATFNKMRPVSYIAMGAAGVSLATSLTAKMWSKK